MEVGESYEIAKEETSQEILATVKKVGGIPPANMRSMSVQIGDGCLKIKFKEPADTVIDSQLLCTVKGCRVIYKAGSAPTDETDGTLAVDNTELGKYADTALTISGLTNGTAYYVGFFPYSDYGLYNRNAANITSGTPQAYILYGYKKAKADSGAASRITYLEMAAGMTAAGMDFTNDKFSFGSWENAFFMPKPYMVKTAGTLDYELDHDDQTKKIDGSTASDISNSSYDGNAMSVFPTIWLYQYEDTDYEYNYICNIQLNSNYHAYAHQREDGTIAEWVAIGMFDASAVSSKYRSLAGLTPTVSTTADQEVAYAHATGAAYDLGTWAQWNLVNTLLTLIGKGCNSQAIYGYGNGNTSAALATGTLKAKPMFYGKAEASSTGTAVKVFYLENWWGNIWQRIQGLLNVNGTIYTKMTRPYNWTGSGYTNTGLTPAGTSGGYISKCKCNNSYGTMPYTASGSATTYECDGLWFNNSQVDVALLGGCWGYAALCGASCVALHLVASYTGADVGARFSLQQPAA